MVALQPVVIHEMEEAVKAARAAVARAAITTHIRQHKRKHLHLKKHSRHILTLCKKGLQIWGLGWCIIQTLLQSFGLRVVFMKTMVSSSGRTDGTQTITVGN